MTLLHFVNCFLWVVNGIVWLFYSYNFPMALLSITSAVVAGYLGAMSRDYYFNFR